MRQKLKTFGKFFIVLTAMTILCTFVWESLAKELYDCTDDIGVPGYWTPGDWIHNQDGNPIISVQRVAHGRSMSEPDSIKAGWNIISLWLLWFSFVAVSITASTLLARKHWIPREADPNSGIEPVVYDHPHAHRG